MASTSNRPYTFSVYLKNNLKQKVNTIMQRNRKSLPKWKITESSSITFIK